MTGVTILAFDCSANACSAALRRDGVVVAARRVEMARGQAEALVPMLEAVLAEARASYAELTALAVTVGPGAFTGLRIGLAVARGIGLAAHLPVIGVTGFDAIAEAIEPGPLPMLVAIDTKRGDFYLRCYDAAGRAAAADIVGAADAVARLIDDEAWLVAGDGSAALAAALAEGHPRLRFAPPAAPDAVAVAAVAMRLWAAHTTTGAPLPPAVPFYMRPPEAKLPAARRA
ncbi:MAG: tRNA (adenosine(37)-N6)-threonylcarbamoyltransferase complex dimerization subunit type 1 TsaB [Alphaproteobacteria bacterium]